MLLHRCHTCIHWMNIMSFGNEFLSGCGKLEIARICLLHVNFRNSSHCCERHLLYHWYHHCLDFPDASHLSKFVLLARPRWRHLRLSIGGLYSVFTVYGRMIFLMALINTLCIIYKGHYSKALCIFEDIVQ